MIGKPKYIKKETFAKKILETVYFEDDLEKISWVIRTIYDQNNKKFLKYKDRLEKLDELYKEFVDDPVKFIEKHDKKTTNQRATKLLKKNPKLQKKLKT